MNGIIHYLNYYNTNIRKCLLFFYFFEKRLYKRLSNVKIGKNKEKRLKGRDILKRRNRKVLKAVKILILCVLLLSLAVFAKTGNNAENKNYKADEKTAVSYKISDYDGRIAVFNASNNEIIEVFDVYLSSLPYDEQNEIKSGIFAQNKQELQKIIEDFTS
jgi:hypothetical protein